MRVGLSFRRHFALHNYTCSITMGVDSISSSSLGCQGLLQSVPSLHVSVAMLYYGIVMVSIGSLSTGSPSISSFSSGECGNATSVSFFSSGECGNAILQYCYGVNRRQLCLLALGLFQSVLSLPVSVTMPYYSIVLVSIGIIQLWLSLLAQGLLQSVPSLQVSAWGNAILQYCNGFNMLR